MADISTCGLSRRAFLRHGSLFLTAATGIAAAPAFAQTRPGSGPMRPTPGPYRPSLRVALVTDVHYADAPARGSRFYRESLAKLDEAANVLRCHRPHLAIELGDLIDSAPAASAQEEIGYLKTINARFAALAPERHYILGNHCTFKMTKAQFMDTVGIDRTYRSFDRGGYRFILLDACYRRDGVSYDAGNFSWPDTDIPDWQKEWLKGELAGAPGKVVVFVHQRLDRRVGDIFTIRTAPEIREILEASGKVVAVFMGHSHRNECREINGIPYITLAAMIEGSGPVNNGYSLLSLYRDGSLRLDGFRQHNANLFASNRVS